MAGEGFEHPCTLVIKKGTGKIRLHAVNINKVMHGNAGIKKCNIDSAVMPEAMALFNVMI